MRKKVITWLALLAIIVATAVVFVGCNNVEEPPKQTDEETTETEATTEAETKTESEAETEKEDKTETETEPEIDTKAPVETNDPGVSTDTEETAEAHVHAFGPWTVVSAATCTEDGTEVRTCDCGEKEERPLAALRHAIETDPAKEPTCTETGLTEGKHCSVCGEVFVAQEEIPALGHDYVNGECTRCGETLYSKGLKFTSNGDGTCYVSGIGTCKDVDVWIPPVSPEGDKVTSIGRSAFRDCTSLTSITIPDSVTSIGSEAFLGCSGLTSITIPDSVTNINNWTFSGCTSLNSIQVDENNTVYHSDGNCLIETATKTMLVGCKTSVIPTDGSVTSIGAYAFYSCTSLTSITIPDSVTSIGCRAFYGCTGLTIITVPDSVTSIEGNAFYCCTGLTSITIPDSVTSIEGNAFYNTGYNNDDSNWENGVLYIGKHLIEAKDTISGSYAIKPGTLTIAGNAFHYCKKLTSITIPDSVTSIGDFAFQYCTGLTSITIPDSVTSIGDYAFYECYGLTSITILDSVTSIGEYAFYDCFNLTSVTIGDSVTSIGHYAFCSCSRLTSITIPDSVTSIGNHALQATNLTSITIPDSVTSIGNHAFEGTNLTSITIPDSVTSIGDQAFSWCEGLISIQVDEGNTKYHSFGNCLIETASKTLVAGCKTSVIPTDGSVTSIGNYALQGCTSLTSVTIPESVTSIGNYAFYYCKKLTSITIPDSVTRIGENAFGGCTGLSSIIIPDSVTSIGEYAFYNCTKLTIKCSSASRLGGWASDWNPSGRPVIWGYTGD